MAYIWLIAHPKSRILIYGLRAFWPGNGLRAISGRPVTHRNRVVFATAASDSETLYRRFGSDITIPDFWRSSLNIIRGQIAEFEAMVG